MSRRLAREVAFRALFQIDIGKCRIKPAVMRALEGFSFSEEEKVFVDDLVAGTLGRQEQLDEIIMKHLVKWKLERISAVDRNLLRLALYEILYRPDIPTAVSINEALELAKKYGSSGEAVGFINGVLDRAVGETLEREY
ncbi:MAG: transcription antitermination factor NusB [Bacillota bacterium]